MFSSSFLFYLCRMFICYLHVYFINFLNLISSRIQKYYGILFRLNICLYFCLKKRNVFFFFCEHLEILLFNACYICTNLLFKRHIVILQLAIEIFSLVSEILKRFKFCYNLKFLFDKSNCYKKS